MDAAGAWWYGFRHREETARGEADLSDLYLAGTHTVTLAPNRPWTLVLSTEDAPEVRGEEALLAAHGHDADVVRAAGGDRLSPFIRQLVIAADAFIVRRDAVAQGESDPLAEGEGRSIVAGYPWFNDWGRDTMIALPGLTLATGRSAEAAAILRAFGRWVVGGLLPNDFPSIAGVTPEYNTVDAALWYIQALRAYHDATGDDALRDELLPVVRAIVEAHIGGTRHGIGVDHADGLLRAGEPGLAAHLDGRPGRRLGRHRPDGQARRDQRPLVQRARDGRVMAPGRGRRRHRTDLHDPRRAGGEVVPQAVLAPGAGLSRGRRRRAGGRRPRPSPEPGLRPVAPLRAPRGGPGARRALDAVGRALHTSYGLRTLAPGDAAYIGLYTGDRRARDGAYHQGTSWAWLMGAYAEAIERVTGDRAAALSVLRPFEAHLADAGQGSISEIFDGDAPHLPRGCPAQAWSVAEVLRVWRLLARE